MITAVGKADLFSLNDFKNDSVIIEVGIECFDGKWLGDFDVSDEENASVRYMAPALGGVGPMTVAVLAENILKSYYLSEADKENIIL